MYALVSAKPHSLLSVQRHHAELVKVALIGLEMHLDALLMTSLETFIDVLPYNLNLQSHVKEFDVSAKSAGALGARRSRLSAELLRYGMDGFKFVENDYYSWVS